MRILLFVMIFTIVFTSTGYTYTINDFDEAFQLYDKKQYEKAKYIFEDICLKQNYEPACMMYAHCYRDGTGVTQNINKALEIYSRPILENNGWAQYNIAQIYEYDKGYPQDIDKAMNIYRKLLSSNDSKLTKRAESGLNRLPIYIFLLDWLGPLADLRNEKINFETYKNSINGIDLSKIPIDLRDKFVQYKQPHLSVAELESRTFGDTMLNIGKSALKGFMGDLSFITDGASDFYKLYKAGDQADESNKYLDEIINLLNKYKVSGKFFNNIGERVHKR